MRARMFFRRGLIYPLFYFLLAIFFLRGVVLRPGMIAEGDWGWPASFLQASTVFSRSLYLWTNQSSLQGQKDFFHTSMLFSLFLRVITGTGEPVGFIQKFFIVFVFTLAGTGLYLLLRYFGLRRAPAFLGGLILISSPVFFNYSIMGWLYVLLSVGLLALSLITFCRSVRGGETHFAVVTGVLYAIAMIQSQVLFWFPIFYLSLIFYLANDRKTLFRYVWSLVVVVGTFALLSSYLWIPLFLGQEQSLNTGYGLAQTSLGTWGRLTYLNILRLWGSLFNYQYESSYSKTLAAFSLVAPIAVLLGGILTRRRRLYLSLLLPVLVLPVAFTLGAAFITRLPFSDIFRDIARVTILSTFSYAALIALWLDEIIVGRRLVRFALGLLVAIAIVVWGWPFFAGEISGGGDRGSDIRMHPYVFPREYYQEEDRLASEKMDTKALYLPITDTFNVWDNRNYMGAYHELWDVFAESSPKPGKFDANDPRNVLLEGNRPQNIVKVLLATSSAEARRYFFEANDIDRVIVRKNASFDDVPWMKEALYQLAKDQSFVVAVDNSVILEFKRMLTAGHFYVPGAIIQADLPANYYLVFDSLTSSTRWPVATVPESTKISIPSVEDPPMLEYRNIDPTSYRVNVYGAKDPFLLVFSETYDPGWKVFYAGVQDRVTGSVSPHIGGLELDEYGASISDRESYMVNGLLPSGLVGAGFISKKIGNTIQNDNLAEEPFYETWFSKPVVAEKKHLVTNGYANGWVVDPKSFCERLGCVVGHNGTYDFALVVEFGPQRLLVVGMFVSMVVSGLVLMYLLACWYKYTRRDDKVVQQDDEKTRFSVVSVRMYLAGMRESYVKHRDDKTGPLAIGFLSTGLLFLKTQLLVGRPEGVIVMVLIIFGISVLSGMFAFAIGDVDGKRKNGLLRKVVILLVLFALFCLLSLSLEEKGLYSTVVSLVVGYGVLLVGFKLLSKVTLLVVLIWAVVTTFLVATSQESLANQTAAMAFAFLGVYAVQEIAVCGQSLFGRWKKVSDERER